MSTRSQILFKFPDGQVLVYRHSDGYPYNEAGVIADLVKFLKWNDGRNTQYDYLIANWFYWSKKWSESYIDIKNKGSLHLRKKDLRELEPVKIGHGLDYDGMLHGDTAYFYTVEFFEVHTKPNIMFSSEIDVQVKIRVYERNYDMPYEYPEQLIRNEKPLMEFFIEHINDYKLVVPKEEEEVIA